MSGIVGMIAALIETWRRRARSRAELKSLDAWLLDDIGLSRDQALKEATKRPWQG